MYNLNEYPQLISEAETNTFKIAQMIKTAKENLSFMDAEVEEAIASNPELKNEQQRKTERLRLRQQPDYLQVKTTLMKIENEHDKSLIKLNFIRNEFSVLKLETRLTIASLEAVA